jgi:aromatic ring hydroxylase
MENIKKKEEEKKVPTVVGKVAATPRVEAIPKPSEAKVKSVIIKNTQGKEMSVDDYFFKGVLPSGFEGTCGKPVEREDLLNVFNKVFRPDDNILFYRQVDKEVYLVIVPIKYSVSVGDFNDSMDGDFQKHAISFLTEGSVNLDTLRQKLERIVKFIKYTDR